MNDDRPTRFPIGSRVILARCEGVVNRDYREGDECIVRGYTGTGSLNVLVTRSGFIADFFSNRFDLIRPAPTTLRSAWTN